jgi:diacylglycerol kinase family enzyme
MSSLLIVNPFASGVDERRLAAVEAALPAALETRFTHAPGEATALARDAAGRDAVYVFGGDGTFNEVLNGIDASTAVGFLPGGGTSVLPRALGLPRDPVACAELLASGARSRAITLGNVNGRRFGFACGIGLDAEVVRAVDALGRRSDGRRPGNVRFAWTAVRTLGKHRFALEPALEVVGAGRAAFAVVVNGPAFTYAGPLAIRPTPGATFDGGLDALAPVRLRPAALPGLARHALGKGGNVDEGSFLRLRDADRIEIVCDRPLPHEVDGEDLGDVEHAVVVAERGAARVLVPAAAA